MDQVLDQKAKPLSSDPVVQIKLNITEMMKCSFFCNMIRLLNTTFFFIGKTLSHGGSLGLNLSICLQMSTLKLRFFPLALCYSVCLLGSVLMPALSSLVVISHTRSYQRKLLFLHPHRAFVRMES